jgi:hypothetical protein
MPRHLKTLVCLFVSVLFLFVGQDFARATERPSADKDLKKAQRILDKLAALTRAASTPSNFKSTVNTSYPELYVKVSSLREGLLKTDLATAVYLHEKAFLAQREGDTTSVDCGLEVRDLYRNICRTNGGLTRAQLLLAKAQLHMDWADSLIRYYRGARDLQTVNTIAEIDRERLIDLRLSEGFVSVLQTLERDVNSYASLGEFEAHNRVAKVSFDQLSNDFKRASAACLPVLTSLPRNSLTYHLQNALNSYADGLFWWQKTYKRKEAVVSVQNWTEPPPRNPLGFDAAGIDYAVVSNWRKAGRHIAIAQVEIERSRSESIAAASLARLSP